MKGFEVFGMASAESGTCFAASSSRRWAKAGIAFADSTCIQMQCSRPVADAGWTGVCGLMRGRGEVGGQSSLSLA